MSNTMDIVTRALGRVGKLLEEHSPEILTAVGIGGGVAATVLAVKATPKAEPVVKELEEGSKNIDDAMALSAYDNQRDANKDRIALYRKTVTGLGRVYAPSIVVGGASIACILYAHGILKKRNAILIAAYQTMERSFAEYRARVVEKEGRIADQQYATPVKKIEKIDSEGKTSTEEVPDPDASVDPYLFFFSHETSHHWQPNPEMNYYFLAARQNHWNDRLRARGHVFLNEVLSDLGFDHTDTGAITGWVWQGEGENCVDFGFEPAMTEQAKDFLSGNSQDVFLRFNVDPGVIIGKGLLNKKHLSKKQGY